MEGGCLRVHPITALYFRTESGKEMSVQGGRGIILRYLRVGLALTLFYNQIEMFLREFADAIQPRGCPWDCRVA